MVDLHCNRELSSCWGHRFIAHGSSAIFRRKKKRISYPIALRGRSAVYLLVCTKTGNAYVGSTKDAAQRLSSHRSSLRGNHHYAGKLQDEWNQYGEDSFVFAPVEYVEDDCMLRKREQVFIEMISGQGRLLNTLSSVSHDTEYMAKISPPGFPFVSRKKSEHP